MSRFNFSTVSQARRCGKLYQYAHIDKLPTTLPDSGDMKFGTAMHMGIEASLEGDDPIKNFDLFWDIEKTKHNRYGRFDWEDLKSQGHILLDRFKRLHQKKFKIHSMEQTLEAQHSASTGITIYGTPDVLGDFEGVPSVIDFKTAGSRYPKEKILCSEQMYLYAWLAQKALGYVAQQMVYVVFIKGREPSIQVLKAPIEGAKLDTLLIDFEVECKRLLKPSEGRYTHNFASCLMGEIQCAYFNVCHGRK